MPLPGALALDGPPAGRTVLLGRACGNGLLDVCAEGRPMRAGWPSALPPRSAQDARGAPDLLDLEFEAPQRS